jgi:hypothetical protein
MDMELVKEPVRLTGELVGSKINLATEYLAEHAEEAKQLLGVR